MQHVRHFNGNGIALVATWVDAVTPFLSHVWIGAVDQLQRRWKMGNRWHRYAIQRNWPDLLKFPEPGVSDQIATNPQSLYWLRKNQNGYINYAPYDKWFRSDEVLEYIAARAESASEVMDPGLCRDIVIEHRKTGERKQAVSMLLTLVAWIEEIKFFMAR